MYICNMTEQEVRVTTITKEDAFGNFYWLPNEVVMLKDFDQRTAALEKNKEDQESTRAFNQLYVKYHCPNNDKDQMPEHWRLQLSEVKDNEKVSLPNKEVDLGGRPLDYPDPKEMQKKINEYFETTQENKLTVTGLCLFLKISKVTMNKYQDRKGYEDIVTLAKLRVEHSYELSLRDKGRSGDIFALKNFGWTDRIENTLIGLEEFQTPPPVIANITYEPEEISEDSENDTLE